MSDWQGTFFWGFLLLFGALMYGLSPRARDEAGFFRGHDARGRPASEWALTTGIFISWIFAKSVANAANLGNADGIVGGLAYAAYCLSIPVAGLVIYRLRTQEARRARALPARQVRPRCRACLLRGDPLTDRHGPRRAAGDGPDPALVGDRGGQIRAAARNQPLRTRAMRGGLSPLAPSASSHTCLPSLRRVEGTARPCGLINNGAAGMPNFAGRRCGVITRIGTSPSPHAPLYGCVAAEVHVDALAVPYDERAWDRDFLANWPPGSPAWRSYYRRITRGPDWAIARATGGRRA